MSHTTFSVAYPGKIANAMKSPILSWIMLGSQYIYLLWDHFVYCTKLEHQMELIGYYVVGLLDWLVVSWLRWLIKSICVFAHCCCTKSGILCGQIEDINFLVLSFWKGMNTIFTWIQSLQDLLPMLISGRIL